MRKTLPLIAVLIGTVVPLSSQLGTSTIIVRKQTVLAAAAEVITIQQPATAPSIGSRSVKFISAYFDCSAACSFTLERNGSAATSTTLAPVNASPQEPAPTTLAFSASNVGVGSILGSYGCSAACQPGIPIDLSGIWFTNAPSGSQNLTLRSNSITATVNIMFKYQETQ